jgi:hypothetical protein
MQPRFIPILAELFDAYDYLGELIDLGKLVNVSFDAEEGLSRSQEYLDLARQLVTRLDQGNRRTLLEMVLTHLEIRNERLIASTQWQAREFHESMRGRIHDLQDELQVSGVPSELAVPEGSPFTAKSVVREFLAGATSEVLVVDPYIGPGTLDCLRDITQPVRILTATGGSAIESGFDRALADFRKEGFIVEIRRGTVPHDRFLLFNDRLFLVGSSLKDAGKKSLNVSEMTDYKDAVRSEIEAKWQSATLYR